MVPKGSTISIQKRNDMKITTSRKWLVSAWLIDHIQRVCGTVVYAGVRLDKDRHFFPPTVKQKTAVPLLDYNFISYATTFFSLLQADGVYVLSSSAQFMGLHAHHKGKDDSGAYDHSLFLRGHTGLAMITKCQ
eukprot:scaffold435_cov275-Chaetoceros_neogracile.AAC.6